MLVKEIMTPDPVCVQSTASVQDVLDVLWGAEVRHIPVVENGELVAIVSDRDVQNYLLPRAEQIAEPTEAQARRESGVDAVWHKEVYSASPDTDVRELINTMIEHRIGAVPVLETSSKHVVGIVSYVDVLRLCWQLL